MATTVNSDLIIYNDEAQTAYLERVQDNLDVFNASSNGAMVLDNELIEGDFRKRALYKLNGSLEHRDVNSDGKVIAKKISAGEAVGVKAPWKYGPYQTTEEAFKRRGRPVDEFSQIIGADVADATLEGFIQYATAALEAGCGFAAGDSAAHLARAADLGAAAGAASASFQLRGRHVPDHPDHRSVGGVRGDAAGHPFVYAVARSQPGP